jgi:hypothetical protein
MVIATGRVRRGAIEVEAGELPEGATVTVIASEGDETFVLGPEEESKLLVAVQEADRGFFISAAELLARIRRS